MEKKLDIDSISNENSVYDSEQFPYNSVKTRGKVLNRLHRKFILCKIDTKMF